jgi:hypothetical protein
MAKVNDNSSTIFAIQHYFFLWDFSQTCRMNGHAMIPETGEHRQTGKQYSEE